MAQAGAKKVYAVEASKMANVAKNNVKENHLENIIEVSYIICNFNAQLNITISSLLYLRFFIQGLKICQVKFKLTS